MACFKGFGSYLPSRIVTNDELAVQLGTTPQYIEDVSGIRERRFASSDESVAAMAAAAGRNCLERSGVDAASLGMIIVASGTSARRFPGPAASVAAALGRPGIPALDIPMASAGSLFGIGLAQDLAPVYGNILVIASERMTDAALAEGVETGTAMLFGDGAGACLITGGDGPLRIVGRALHSDGTFAEDLRWESTGGILMNGRSIIMQASRKIPAAIAEVLKDGGVHSDDVCAFVMHQANQHLMDRVAKALKISPERFYSNIGRYGNTSSASMLIAASEWWAAGSPPVGSYVVFAAFGAGLHWGAVLGRS